MSSGLHGSFRQISLFRSRWTLKSALITGSLDTVRRYISRYTSGGRDVRGRLDGCFPDGGPSRDILSDFDDPGRVIGERAPYHALAFEADAVQGKAEVHLIEPAFPEEPDEIAGIDGEDAKPERLANVLRTTWLLQQRQRAVIEVEIEVRLDDGILRRHGSIHSTIEVSGRPVHQGGIHRGHREEGVAVDFAGVDDRREGRLVPPVPQIEDRRSKR